MFKKRYLFIILTIITFSEIVLSQTFVNSPYSIFGVGNLQDQTSIQNQGMGGLSLATRSDYSINLANPAGNSALSPTSFVFEVGAQSIVNKLTASNVNQTTGNTSLNRLALGFPVSKNVSFYLALLPYSDISYKILNTNTVQNATKVYSESFDGSGGINRFTFGTSIRPFKNLSLGIGGSYLFGNLNNTYRTTFDSTTYQDSKVLDKYTISGTIFDLGLQYSYPIKEDLTILFGAKYAKKFTVDATMSQLATNTVPNTDFDIDTVVNTTGVKGTLVIPAIWGLGLSLVKTDKFLIGAEYSTQQWHDYQLTGSSVTLNNAYDFRVGGEYIPNANSIAKGEYLKHVKYRMGFDIGQSYINYQDHTVAKKSIMLGLGLPLKVFKYKDTNYGPIFNISFEYGQRGTTDNNLIKENFTVIRFGLVMKDIWFERTKLQ